MSRFPHGSTWAQRAAGHPMELYCVLDDADRRKTGKLVQWALPLAEAKPISLRSSDKPNYGFLDIDKRTYWYYSLDLFPEPEALKSAISELIRKAEESRHQKN